MRFEDIKNLRVTIMGLGLNGGGLQSALFFLRHGAQVTVTDLKSEEILRPSLEQLSGFQVKLVIGRHELKDFTDTDLVIKNPGVPDSSQFLKAALDQGVRVETDISIFLALTTNPLIAVTGSKGKSTTVSAIYHSLKAVYPGARLGGNITVSPLSFLHELKSGDPVVLELSSWQLADISNRGGIRPKVALITNILPDHMNAYNSMFDYIEDKKIIFRDQRKTRGTGPDTAEYSVFNYDDEVLRQEAENAEGEVIFFSAAPLPEHLSGGWLEGDKACFRLKNKMVTLFEGPLKIRGQHNRINLLGAAVALKLFGLSENDIATHIPTFGGIDHRMELFLETGGIRFYNDSAATIPHAVVAAVKSLDKPIFLITGGTDKNIDFSPLEEILGIPEGIFLLRGTGTDKILEILNRYQRPYQGPFESIEAAVEAVAKTLDGKGSVILSPGCASFGMFLNEFDRGRKYKAAVMSIWGK